MARKGEFTHNLVIPLKEGLVKIKCSKVVSNIMLITQKEDYMLLYESCKKWLDDNGNKVNDYLPFDIDSVSSLSLENNFLFGMKYTETLMDCDKEIQKIISLISDNYDKKNEQYDVEELKQKLKGYKLEDEHLKKMFLSNDTNLMAKGSPMKRTEFFNDAEKKTQEM